MNDDNEMDTIVDMTFKDMERIQFSKKEEFLRVSQMSLYQIERASLIEIVQYIQFKRSLNNKDRFRILVQIFFDRYMDMLFMNVNMLLYIFKHLEYEERSYFLNPIALILGLYSVYTNDFLPFQIQKDKIDMIIDHMEIFEIDNIQLMDVIKYARFWIQLQQSLY